MSFDEFADFISELVNGSCSLPDCPYNASESASIKEILLLDPETFEKERERVKKYMEMIK